MTSSMATFFRRSTRSRISCLLDTDTPIPEQLKLRFINLLCRFLRTHEPLAAILAKFLGSSPTAVIGVSALSLASKATLLEVEAVVRASSFVSPHAALLACECLTTLPKIPIYRQVFIRKRRGRLILPLSSYATQLSFTGIKFRDFLIKFVGNKALQRSWGLRFKDDS